MEPVDQLAQILGGRRTFVLVGAGCSTESGIPDYRGPETLARARNPIRFRSFVDDPRSRRRYWARSYAGWPRIAGARPNPAHHALAELERAGAVTGLVTQNVDGLHHAAGSQRVIELHGALRTVECLSCGVTEDRQALQLRMTHANPWFSPKAEIAPDGDADLDPTDAFVAPACRGCGGPLKPAVVFFGENVPRSRVDGGYALLERSEAALVVGSSLTVFSGYRFVKRAAERGLPIGILNLGPTRGDPLATVRVDGLAGEILPALRERLA